MKSSQPTLPRELLTIFLFTFLFTVSFVNAASCPEGYTSAGSGCTYEWGAGEYRCQAGDSWYCSLDGTWCKKNCTECDVSTGKCMGCQNECSEGSYKCQDSIYSICERGEEGCYIWSYSKTCVEICMYNFCARKVPCGTYGDTDDDGYVTINDFQKAMALWVNNMYDSRLDLDGDGKEVVTDSDVAILEDFLINENIDTFPVCSILETKADLTIDRAWLDGSLLYYVLKNNGTSDVNISTRTTFYHPEGTMTAITGPVKARNEITEFLIAPDYFNIGDTIKICADTDNVIVEINESNNCLQVILSRNLPETKADLTIDRAWLDGSLLYYVLKNNGTSDVNISTRTTFYHPEGTMTAITGPVKARGETIEFLITPDYFRPGDTIKICADTDNNVSELNESNNCLQVILPVGPPEPEIEEAKLTFRKGWNMISLPFDRNVKISDILDDCSLYKYRTRERNYYYALTYDTVNGIFTGSEYEIEPWRGYYVYSVEDCVATVPAKETSPPQTLILHEGWNIIPGLNVYLSDILKQCKLGVYNDEYVWYLNPATNHWEHHTFLEAGKSYWVYASEPCTFKKS